MDKFNNKYRIATTRLQGYDYGAHGGYFVTICTKNRLHYFGEIENVVNVVETGNCPSLQHSQHFQFHQNNAICFWCKWLQNSHRVPHNHNPVIALWQFDICY